MKSLNKYFSIFQGETGNLNCIYPLGSQWKSENGRSSKKRCKSLRTLNCFPPSPILISSSWAKIFYEIPFLFLLKSLEQPNDQQPELQNASSCHAIGSVVLPIPVSELKPRQVGDGTDLTVLLKQSKHWVRNVEIFDSSGMSASRLSDRS